MSLLIVTKIVMDSGFQLSELKSVSLMSNVTRIIVVIIVRSWSGHGQARGSISGVLKTLIVSGAGRTNQGTRSPMELLWTAKNTNKPSLNNVFCD